MSNLMKMFIFGKNIEIDEREEKTVYELFANTTIFTFIICLGAIIYDLIVHKNITEVGFLSLIIILIISYYIFFMMRIKKVYLDHKENKLSNTFLATLIFFSVFTLLTYLSGEKIDTITIIINSIGSLIFGGCIYSLSKYNQKKIENEE
ncbi:hypothetical protein [Bacillus cereus]|nr:hypothetical protein [Bacillus cereus]HDR7806500.1 hypothetical protein [Bacillus cereus]